MTPLRKRYSWKNRVLRYKLTFTEFRLSRVELQYDSTYLCDRLHGKYRNTHFFKWHRTILWWWSSFIILISTTIIIVEWRYDSTSVWLVYVPSKRRELSKSIVHVSLVPYVIRSYRHSFTYDYYKRPVDHTKIQN